MKEYKYCPIAAGCKEFSTCKIQTILTRLSSAEILLDKIMNVCEDRNCYTSAVVDCEIFRLIEYYIKADDQRRTYSYIKLLQELKHKDIEIEELKAKYVKTLDKVKAYIDKIKEETDND